MRKIIVALTLMFAITVCAQSRKLADRYFKEFAYPKAVELYKGLYKKGDTSKYVMKRISASYYNNAQTKDAVKWYSKLIKKHRKLIQEKTLFQYAQALRSNGGYKKSDSIFATLNKYVLGGASKSTDLLLSPRNNGVKISLRNLKINTQYSDFGGFIFGEQVYFASSRPVKGNKKIYKWNNQPFLNIYKSTLSFEDLDKESLKNDSQENALILDNLEVLEDKITTVYHESNAVITKDGKTMYFTRLNTRGRKGKKLKRNKKKDAVNLKILKAEFRRGKWTNISELPFNSNHYSVGHPALSPDEKTLYFISDMPGTLGQTDIFKVSIQDDNSYGEPENLGSQINTPAKEMFPFFSTQGVLYFSSNGLPGIGLLDIYQSKLQDDGTFSKPENLDYPFNSNRDDFAFNINDEEKYGFFSSNRSNGKGDDDIYSFIVEKPCRQHVKGVVSEEESRKPLSGVTVKLISSDGEVIEEMITDVNGKYSFKVLGCNKNYTILAEKTDYTLSKKNLKTTNKSDKKHTVNLRLKPLIVGDKIVINPIYFDFDKSDIRESAKYELENVITVMNNNPKMVIKIESHTDSRGSKSYNRNLSDRRAKATRGYIYSRGIDKSRIKSAIGYGEDRLLNKCSDSGRNKCTEKEHQLNRRSYFIILSGAPNVSLKTENKK